MSDPLIITRDELHSDNVEKTLREHKQISQTKSHYENAKVVSRVAKQQPSLLQRAAVYLTLFGLLGGLLGWGIGQFLHLRPDVQARANAALNERAAIQSQISQGTLDPEVAAFQLSDLDRVYGNNPFYQVETDPTLGADERTAKSLALLDRERTKDRIADVLLFAIAGAFLGAALSAAEPAVGRNWTATLRFAAVGATVGFVGGAAAGLIAVPLQTLITGGVDTVPSERQLILARAAVWGVLGMCLAAAPGVAMRSGKRAGIGLVAGLVCGAIGGVLYGPILETLSSEPLSRLAALLLIGGGAGLASAWVEDAIKDGWLRVTAGPIAGKQFVLYRDPTYVGAAPNSHIYLFNDNKVGRRHAAVHKSANGYEIENLPLGGPTTVNGRPVQRAKLLRGDVIGVGSTNFEFGEKPK
ncbi:MAG: FHA domain-containing protein [Planctomycetota bacterium]